MFQPTIWQANNPSNLPVSLDTEELVLESELPERLQELNNKTQYITISDNITEIPEIKIDEIRVKGVNMNNELSITSGVSPHEPIMNFYNDKSATCYGHLVATNVNWTNKTDIETLQNKTKNINTDGNSLNNITSINGIKIGTPHAFNFNYWTYSPYIPVCNAFSGATTIGHTLFFKDEMGDDYAGVILTCNARGQLEIMGRFSADMYKTDVGFALRQYKNTSMKFMKYDDETSMLTLNSLDDTATFLGNVIAPNITTIENKTQNIDADLNNIYFNSTVQFNRMKIQNYSTVIVDHNESPIMEIFNDKRIEFFGPIRSDYLDMHFGLVQGITYDMDNNKTIINQHVKVNGDIEANNLQGITYDEEVYEEPATRINHTLIVEGYVISENIYILSLKCTPLLYIPEDQILYIGNNVNIDGLLNGNRIGAPDIFAYNDVTPFIPIVNSNGIIEVGNRIDFHRATEEEDFSTCLTNNALNQISIQNTNGTTFGNLELSGLTIRPSSNHSCRLIANTASNLLWYNNSGVNTWVCDATGTTERWSVTRDNALAAFTRTTGMTYTAATTDPVNPANTNFAHNITSSECYSGRYHTWGTSSLPMNAVSNSSSWGAIRIVRTGLAQNTPCGFQFGRGNDSTTMPNNYCAIYYVSPTADISKGEIRIGTEKEANTSSTNCITFDTDTKITKFPANITAPNITGIAYNNNFLLQSSDYTTATVINNHIQIDLTSVTYKAHLGMRIHKYDLANDQEMMFQLGKSNTRAISFVYRNTDSIDNSQYRLDFAGRSAYICKYGATKTEHEIRGNLKVFGTITENASKTITHYTKYEGNIKLGCFVENTGKIYRDEESTLSPYEDCITIVKQSLEYNNNIIGVCTEIIDEEFCKYATHGDVLIKCESATYTLGDILIPSHNGYAKKANNMEIIDAMTHMIPRLKVTSVETETLDSETVCAFISL